MGFSGKFSHIHILLQYGLHQWIEKNITFQMIVGSLVSEKGHFLKIHVKLYL